MGSVAQITRIPVRDVWKREDTEFTPWLNQNIELLNDAIGLKLDQDEAAREQPAGDFKVDLVTNDGQGNRVIIENQLEASDHSHLGQLVTYASALDAKIAIWVCATPRAEHAEAVNWLNKGFECKFFLVKVEAICIGDSDPAPLFTLIAGPSDLAEYAREESVKDLAAKEKRQAFWREVLEEDSRREGLFVSISPRGSTWIQLSRGFPTGCSLQISVSNHAAIVYFHFRLYDDEAGTYAFFERVKEKRAEVEQKFGQALDWGPEGNKSCKVGIKLPGGGLLAEDKWGEIAVKIVDALYRLNSSLAEAIEEAAEEAE